jgi:hypothetical protein
MGTTRVAHKFATAAPYICGRAQLNTASELSAMRAERIATSVRQFVLFILTWAITFIVALIIVPGIHESGHAGACLIEGGTVTQWHPFAFGTEPHTACNTKLDPFFCAAGSLTSVGGWLLCTYIFSRRAARLGTGHLRNFVAALWFWWSFWVFGELFMDANHAYSDVPLHHDAGYFVRLTEINPTVASAVILSVIAILSVPLVRVVAQTLREGGFGG